MNARLCGEKDYEKEPGRELRKNKADPSTGFGRLTTSPLRTGFSNWRTEVYPPQVGQKTVAAAATAKHAIRDRNQGCPIRSVEKLFYKLIVMT